MSQIPQHPEAAEILSDLPKENASPEVLELLSTPLAATAYRERRVHGHAEREAGIMVAAGLLTSSLAADPSLADFIDPAELSALLEASQLAMKDPALKECTATLEALTFVEDSLECVQNAMLNEH